MQDSNPDFIVHAPVARKEDVRMATASIPRSTHSVVHSPAQHTHGLFWRFLAFFTRIFPFSRMRMKAPTRREELLESVVTEKNASNPDAPSLIFKGSTASTLVTPLGTYAGKSPSLDLRKMAEKQFHAIQSSEGATIN